MSVAAAYGVYAVKADFTDGTALTIDQVTDENLTHGLDKLKLFGSGYYRPTFQTTRKADPIGEFTTQMITSLNTFTIGGALIDSDVDDVGLELYFQLLDTDVNRAAGSNHMAATINLGRLQPMTINAGLDDAATLVYQATISYDGTNAPIVYTDSQALPSVTAADECFFAGPISINGTSIADVQNTTIEFNPTVRALRAGGPYPTFVYLLRYEPVIRCTILDASKLATYGISGVPQGATDSIVYLQKGSANGARVADNVAEHISFTMDDGTIWVDTARSAEEQEGEVVLVLDPNYDDSNEILVLSIATTIA